MTLKINFLNIISWIIIELEWKSALFTIKNNNLNNPAKLPPQHKLFSYWFLCFHKLFLKQNNLKLFWFIYKYAEFYDEFIKWIFFAMIFARLYLDFTHYPSNNVDNW